MMAAMRAMPSTSPFLAVPEVDQRQGLRLHADGAGGDRDAVGFVLGADVDHVGLAGGVEVGQSGEAGAVIGVSGVDCGNKVWPGGKGRGKRVS
jgi:hypothetical protein